MVRENGMIMMSEKEFEKFEREYKSKIFQLEANAILMRDAIKNLMSDKNQTDVRVSRKDFLKIREEAENEMFKLSEGDEKYFTKENQMIYEHDVTVHWHGIYCNCGDGATPSNYIIPAIEGCDDEWDGEEW